MDAHGPRRFSRTILQLPYYFVTPRSPIIAITDWQRELQTLIGQNHASILTE